MQASLYKRQRRYDRRFTNFSIIHDDSGHANHGILFDATAVKNRSVSDMTPALNDGLRIRESMNHAVILQVTAFFENDPAEIAAQ
jgi:hypothetical protein